MAGSNRGIDVQITKDLAMVCVLFIFKGQSTYAPAEYTYPFDWDLPVDLPISFDAKYGYIRYKIVAGLDRPLRLDKCYKELFTVMKRVDLNKIPDLNVWQTNLSDIIQLLFG